MNTKMRYGITAVLLAFSLSACGASANMNSQSASYVSSAPAASMAGGGEQAIAKEAGMVSMDAAVMPVPQEENAAPISYQRKQIKSIDLRLETREYDKSIEELASVAESFGGYIETSNIEGTSLYDTYGVRSARFTMRIPTEKLTEFLETLGESYNIRNKSESVEDITDRYYDTESRIASLRLREKNLLGMLESATDLQSHLEIDRELAQVRYELESLIGQINRMDSQVSLSSVFIVLEEVVEYTDDPGQPASFVERIQQAFAQSQKGFVRSMQNTLIGAIFFLPYLVIFAVVIIGLLLMLRRKKTAKVPAQPPVAKTEASSVPNDPSNQNTTKNEK